ncbi:MAG: hypothetical protein KatS3mg124_0827 [Porticoccaceae bacterium]|nr:MAG: hypothetical protein KatS3mg124_0827 [Porticoccaceae bacterium]
MRAMPLRAASRFRAFPAPWHWPVLVALVAGVTGCATPGSPAAPERAVESLLYAQYERWKGVPYRLGGSSQRGVDCSGLVQRVYRDAFGVVLPRNTWDQSLAGRPVPPEARRPGDLVFFKMGLWGNHVGIYLGDDRFLHASKSAGVTISSLREPYWRRHYWKTVRIPTARLAGR